MISARNRPQRSSGSSRSAASWRCSNRDSRSCAGPCFFCTDDLAPASIAASSSLSPRTCMPVASLSSPVLRGAVCLRTAEPFAALHAVQALNPAGRPIVERLIGVVACKWLREARGRRTRPMKKGCPYRPDDPVAHAWGGSGPTFAVFCNTRNLEKRSCGSPRGGLSWRCNREVLRS